MKKGILSLALLTVLQLFAVADRLVVYKNGTSEYVSKARKEGDVVIFAIRDTGKEKRVAAGELDAVIPILRRGKGYKPEEIDKYIKRIDHMRLKHPRLLRQLNPIRQEWEALKKPAPELEGKISELETRFRESDKDTVTYRRITLDLGMMKYKDLGGKYMARIDKLTADIKEEYLTVNLERMENLAEPEKLTVDRFVHMKRLATELDDMADEERKGRITALVTSARAAAYDAGLKHAVTSFAANKTLAAYLHSVRVLYELRNHVAETRMQKAGLERRVEQMQAEVAAGETAYDFDILEGYPLNKADQDLLWRYKHWRSNVLFQSIDQDKQCEFFPLQSPGSIRFRSPFEARLRLVFGREQPAGRKFGMVVMTYNPMGLESYTVNLPEFKIVNGHADVAFRVDFSGFKEGFKLVGDEYGRVKLYMYLAYLAPNSTPERENWQAISRACSWPMGQ